MQRQIRKKRTIQKTITIDRSGDDYNTLRKNCIFLVLFPHGTVGRHKAAKSKLPVSCTMTVFFFSDFLWRRSNCRSSYSPSHTPLSKKGSKKPSGGTRLRNQNYRWVAPWCFFFLIFCDEDSAYVISLSSRPPRKALFQGDLWIFSSINTHYYK